MSIMFKFGSTDVIKFIKIYRKHECLWNAENISYKNRHARNAALVAFAKEFNVEGFGPREITLKIKNLRTQYLAEKKKIKKSMGSGSDTDDTYKPKLIWYNLMDSFLDKAAELGETCNPNNISESSLQEYENQSILDEEKLENFDVEHYSVSADTGMFKFKEIDVIKLIKIYRNHSCLWDTNNKNFKSRQKRNAALTEMAKEFGVEGFGPLEVGCKIKNLRTQYYSEKKKIKESMCSGSSYTPKLYWYNLMDSILNKSSEPRETARDPNIFIKNPLEEDENHTFLIMNDFGDSVKGDNLFSTFTKSKRKSPSGEWDSSHSLEALDNTKKRLRSEETDDNLDIYGKYVASTLRSLNNRNCIYAQDEIQAILTKYKLKNIEDFENSV